MYKYTQNTAFCDILGYKHPNRFEISLNQQKFSSIKMCFCVRAVMHHTVYLDLVKVFELPGRVRRVELHQVPHSDCSLRGLPQVPQLPHGLQVFPQRTEPHQHPAPNAHRRTGQVRVLHLPKHAWDVFNPHVEKHLQGMFENQVKVK